MFRMPSSDATSPDLMRDAGPQNPSLTIVKGPQMGSNFELTDSDVTIGRDPSNAIFLNDFVLQFSDKCTRCGICVGLCPVTALSLEPKEAKQ
jgi:ferredoxin